MDMGLRVFFDAETFTKIAALASAMHCSPEYVIKSMVAAEMDHYEDMMAEAKRVSDSQPLRRSIAAEYCDLPF